jgi:hypothetical protein
VDGYTSDTVSIYMEIANGAASSREFALADKMFKAALDELSRHDKELSLTARKLLEVARTYFLCDELRRAESSLKRASIIFKQIAGPKSEDYACTLDRLADVSMATKKIGQAAQYLRRAAAADIGLDKRSVERRYARFCKLAQLCQRRKRFDEMKQAFDAAQALRTLEIK